MDQEKRESGVFYRSFYEAGKSLTEEQRGKYYTLIFDLMFEFQKRKSDDPIVNAMLLLIAPQIEANIRKYFNWKEPKINQDESKQEANQKQDWSETEGNVDVYVDDDEDVDEEYTAPKGATVSKRFTKPTLEQVKEYCDSRKNWIEPDAFIAHYDAVWWVYGKDRKPVKDWKACVRTREQKRKEEQKAKEPQTMDQRLVLYNKMWHVPFRIKYWSEKATEVKLYSL